MAIHTVLRFRFDLMREEPVLDGVDHRPIFHAYPDTLPTGATLTSYTIEELFAEEAPGARRANPATRPLRH